MNEISIREKLHMAKLGILASLPTAIMFCNSVIVCAKAEEEAVTGTTTNVTQKIDNSSISIYGTMKAVFMSLLLVVLGACALVLLIGTKTMIDWVKNHFYHIVIACMILFLAQDIADWLEETFG